MQDPGFTPISTTDLDQTGVAVYREVVQAGRFDAGVIAVALGLAHDEVERCRDVLVALRLLRPASDGSAELVPVRPTAAAAQLLGPLEANIYQHQQFAERVRDQLRALEPAYADALRSHDPHEAIDLLDSTQDVRNVLTDAANHCRREFMAVQPGGARSPEVLHDALPRAVAMLRRGVRMRSLYQHSARASLPTQAYVREVSQLGAEVRTRAELTDRLIIFDKEIAFVPDRTRVGHGTGAVVVREPAVVEFLCGLFERLWSTATDFVPSGETYREVSDDMKSAIIEMLASGVKDEVVARRLGVSVRTCRRHIAEIMQELNATSRFQAGVHATRAGLVPDLDGRG